MHPAIGFLLFAISVVLLLLTGPLGFIYGVFHSVFTKGLSGLAEYLLKLAVSIDQLGNVMMQHLLNFLWIKKGGYPFGNRDETISSALGRNRKLGTLTTLGRGIDRFLDFIDPNHSLNSIDYYIEPSEFIIDKLAWVHIRDKKLLSVRSKGRKLFYLPGGKRAKGETDTQALTREVNEELGVDLLPGSIRFLGIFEAQADGKEPGVIVRLTSFEALYEGLLAPDSEIEEMAWLPYAEKDKLSLAGRVLMDFLHNRAMV